jgi:hypothetical protein
MSGAKKGKGKAVTSKGTAARAGFMGALPMAGVKTAGLDLREIEENAEELEALYTDLEDTKQRQGQLQNYAQQLVLMNMFQNNQYNENQKTLEEQDAKLRTLQFEQDQLKRNIDRYNQERGDVEKQRRLKEEERRMTQKVRAPSRERQVQDIKLLNQYMKSIDNPDDMDLGFLLEDNMKKPYRRDKGRDISSSSTISSKSSVGRSLEFGKNPLQQGASMILGGLPTIPPMPGLDNVEKTMVQNQVNARNNAMNQIQDMMQKLNEEKTTEKKKQTEQLMQTIEKQNKILENLAVNLVEERDERDADEQQMLERKIKKLDRGNKIRQHQIINAQSINNLAAMAEDDLLEIRNMLNSHLNNFKANQPPPQSGSAFFPFNPFLNPVNPFNPMMYNPFLAYASLTARFLSVCDV